MTSISDSLAAAVAALPAGPIDTLRQVGVDVRTFNSGTTTLLVYELHATSGWGQVSVVIGDEGNERKIFGFRTDRLEESFEVTNDIRRGAKNPVRLLVLTLALGLAVFCLCVAVIAIRARIRRRWLWALFALVGATQFSLNWTTGEVSYNPFQFVLFSAAFLRFGAVGPWFVSVAFPAGAIATLYRLRREKEAMSGVSVAPAQSSEQTRD